MLGKSGAGVCGAQSAPEHLRARTMLPLYCALLAAAAAAPATYDQRQDGEFNVRADVQNVVLLVAVPQKMSLPSSIFDGFLKNGKQNVHDFQERADVRVMEAFVEPSMPYHVEIGGGSDPYEDGRAVEVVIAGRRRLEVEPHHEAGEQSENRDADELKLIGATEQCGPDRERDPDTLTCRDRAHHPEVQPTPAQSLSAQKYDQPPAQSEYNLQELSQQNTPQVFTVAA